MRKAIGIVGVILFITAMLGGVLAYFVCTTDQTTNIMYDGFGRRLSESPFLMRWIFGEERVWAGWKWFFLDMVIFWGTMILGYGLVSFGFRDSDKIEETE